MVGQDVAIMVDTQIGEGTDESWFESWHESHDSKRGLEKELKVAAIIACVKPEMRAMDVRQKAFISSCGLWLEFFYIPEDRKDHVLERWEIEILLYRFKNTSSLPSTQHPSRGPGAGVSLETEPWPWEYSCIQITYQSWTIFSCFFSSYLTSYFSLFFLLLVKITQKNIYILECLVQRYKIIASFRFL